MNIKKKTFVLHNVIQLQKTMNKDDLGQLALLLRAAIIEKGLYPTSPVIYQKEVLNEDSCRYTMYVAVDQAVKLSSQDVISYLPSLEYEQGLCIRHLSDDNNFDSDEWLLEECARSNHLVLIKPFFHIMMNVYGDAITDIYAPIKGEKI